MPDEMADLSLYRGPVIGLLRGFSQSGLQLELDVVVPHRDGGLPGFGEFLMVEAGPGRAIVGRVCQYKAAGRLMTDQGDSYLADLSRSEERPPAPIVRQMLRYTVKLGLLGQLHLGRGGFRFTVGDREFATFGSPVREPSDAALAYLCNVNLEDDPSAARLGELVYGQRVLADVPIKFSVDRLKARRSFVFARAGYGKSNLIKYLVSQLYTSPPDVGLLIFDVEGEYALPDASGRPALASIPGLADRLSLYTNRPVPQRFAALKKGDMHIDFGDFPPQDILASLLPGEKQEMVFANLVRSLRFDAWRKLIAHLAEKQFKASDDFLAETLEYRPQRKKDAGDVSIAAIKNNLVPPIRRLHRAGSPIGRNLIEELRQGRIVIADTSLLGSEDALAISGLLLRRLFEHNRRHFTDPSRSVVRCLAIIEEAQAVLGNRQMDDRNIFVRWVKEGRKYDLGVVLVTQQPGAIADQIISQGDNFFVLHLLNDADLATLRRHNAYFSEDILGVIRSEPIPGNCYFWSAPDQPFVLPVRVREFGKGESPVGASAARSDASAARVDAFAQRTDASAPRGEASAPRVKASAPQVGASASQGDASARQVEASAPRVEASGPRVDASAPRGDASTRRIDTPAPGADASAPQVGASAPRAERNSTVGEEQNGELHLQPMILDVLGSHPDVWLYRVARRDGEQVRSPGEIAFAFDYLLSNVASRLRESPASIPAEDPAAWLQQVLPARVEQVLASLGGHAGFAVLAGSTRKVWALPATAIQLTAGKQPRGTHVEVRRTI